MLHVDKDVNIFSFLRFQILFLCAAFLANAETKPLEIQDIYGKSQTLFAKTNNLGTVFVFILQDCPISNSYVPEINRLVARYTNFTFHLVQVDMDLDLVAARKHAEEFQIKPGVLLDPEHQLVKLAGAKITPEAAVFSNERKLIYLGRIDDTYIAPMKKRRHTTQFDLREALEAISAGKPVPNPKN